MTDATDARGVPITVGATCIYGAAVGRSIALVEGVIDGYTASGRVWVKVVRRAYGGSGIDRAERVHVGADRLVIVDALPACELPTQAEVLVRERRDLRERYRRYIEDVEAGGPLPSWARGDREEALRYYRERLTDLEAA
ncbi:hypothetical protein ACWGHD_19045 [Streptomyces xanthophaeus]